MRLFMNRLIVNIKRCMLSPFMYVMAAVLITLALFCILIPESEKSVYLPVAILNNDDNEKTEEIVEELCDMRSVFEFYEVGSEEEMLDDLAQGKANTGFVIPEDFLERSTGTKKPHEIAVITTPTSGLTSLATEEVCRKPAERDCNSIGQEEHACHKAHLHVRHAEVKPYLRQRRAVYLPRALQEEIRDPQQR